MSDSYDEKIEVTVKPEQKVRIREAAERRGLNMSSFIRLVTLREIANTDATDTQE